MLVANALCDLRFLFCVSGELSILNIWRKKERDEARSMSLECVNRGGNLPIIFRQKQLIFRSLEESKSEEVVIRRRKGDMFSIALKSPVAALPLMCLACEKALRGRKY